MCCPLNHVNGKLVIQAIAFEETEEPKEKICHLQGIYDHTPLTLADRVFRFFQRLELIEKIAEIADESFHLFGKILQRFTSVLVYQTLRNLHHASHDIEHVLHSFCFLGDLSRLITGKFFEYHDKERLQPDYLRSTAAVCHAMSHMLSTATFLSEHKLAQFGRFEKMFKYAAAFNALGYAIWTASLIWRRHQGIVKDQFASDLCIHFGGCLFEALPLTQSISTFTPHASGINKMAAIAGIIHAWSVVQRLMPQDREEVAGQFAVPEEDILEDSPHDHSHHEPHDHVHSFRFRRVVTN